jgi:hypothetical protein
MIGHGRELTIVKVETPQVQIPRVLCPSLRNVNNLSKNRTFSMVNLICIEIYEIKLPLLMEKLFTPVCRPHC